MALPRRADDSGHLCPRCEREVGPPRRRFRLGDLVLGFAAAGLVGLIVSSESGLICDGLEADADASSDRSAALARYQAKRCGDGLCDEIELVSMHECGAKIRVREQRLDEYGEPTGTFESVEGLVYSPLFERWHVEEVLDDKQVLGLPSY